MLPGTEDSPHSRRTDMVAEAGHLAVHPAVAPRRILPRQPQHQVTDLLVGRRPARLARVGPLAGDQTAVPGQQRSRCDQSAAPPGGGQRSGQGRQDRAVGPVRPRPGHLPAQHHHLMAQHQDLRVLRCLAAAQQDQPARHPDHDQIQQTDRHEPRSCLSPSAEPNRSSQALYRVLKRYRLANQQLWRLARTLMTFNAPIMIVIAVVAAFTAIATSYHRAPAGALLWAAAAGMITAASATALKVFLLGRPRD